MTAHSSVWIGGADAPTFAPLAGDVDIDVVVVGAGISGLTTALLLQRNGHHVAVVDMHWVATGTTGHTTGKVTSQHILTYDRLAWSTARTRPKAYGDANHAGVEMGR